MKSFHLQQKQMHPDSFTILCHSAERFLALRGISLDGNGDSYTVTLITDPALENDRYVISQSMTARSSVPPMTAPCTPHSAVFCANRNSTVSVDLHP